MSASLAAVVAASLVAAAPTASAARPASGTPVTVAESSPGPDQVLRRPAHGADAIERLGNDLAEVAALNDMTTAELRELLLSDRTLWVHPTGLLYYVDPAPSRTEVDDLQAAEAPYPYDQTFALHSKPDSSRTIYLDFDGHTVSGTAWNQIPAYSLPSGGYPAWSLDGNAATFSNAERDAIQSIWQRVSEDYAPFDVDVTTEDPGVDALRRTTSEDTVFGTRALISPSQAAANAICGGECGGSAFMGTFDITIAELGGGVAGSDFAQPAWVFPQNLLNDTKAIAEAVSHEVGHNLDLDHDGSPAGGYYSGQGSWAPIMGTSYDRPISQWSKGEYTGANNLEDDLTVITQNGLSFVPDDHGDSVAAATPLTAAARTASGTITTRTDRDVFAFPQSCTGSVTFSVDPAPTSPNLDVQLRLLSGDGGVLATSDPVSSTSNNDVALGLDAIAGIPVTSGSTMYVEVDGVGAGSPATNGYSDYASLGRYTVSSTGCSDAPASRPDLLISTKETKGYIGDDVYNRKGKGQTKQVSASRGQTRSFFVMLTNDGSTTETFAFTAAKAPKGTKITYLNNGNDITDLLTAPGGGVVPLAPEQFALVQVKVKLTKKAAVGTKKTAVLTAESLGADALTDVVKGTVKVVKK